MADSPEVADMRARKDEAYRERNMVVAALARVFPSGIKRTDIPGWDPEWHSCVYIDSPAGQLSWYYHDSEAHLFAGLPTYAGAWDGHDTPEKYRRLAALTTSPAAGVGTVPVRVAVALDEMDKTFGVVVIGGMERSVDVAWHELGQLGYSIRICTATIPAPVPAVPEVAATIEGAAQ